MNSIQWRYCIVVLVVILLAGCGGQGEQQKPEQEVSIRKIADISGGGVSASDETAESAPVEANTGKMTLEALTVEMVFPDGWKVDDNRGEEIDYQSIYGNEYDRSWDFRAGNIDKELVEITIDDKIGDSMDAKGTSKTLEEYIKEEITYETNEYYKSTDQYVWQDPTYKTVAINDQKYIKVSGVTKAKKDAGDAHVGYFTIVNGVILEFVFQTEAAVIDEATQSTFDNIMSTITYAY